MRCLIVFVSLLACLLIVGCEDDPPATDDCPSDVEMPAEVSPVDVGTEVSPVTAPIEVTP
jgi:hypothetical protein